MRCRLFAAALGAAAARGGAGSPTAATAGGERRMLGIVPPEQQAAFPQLVSVSPSTGTTTLIGELPYVMAPVAGLAAVRHGAPGGGDVVHYVALDEASNVFELRGAWASNASEAHPPVTIPLPVDDSSLGIGMYLQLHPGTGDVYIQGFVWANSTAPLRVPVAGGPPPPPPPERVAVVQTVRVAPFAGTVERLATFGAGWVHALLEGGSSFFDAKGGKIWAQFARPMPATCPFQAQGGVRWKGKGKKPKDACPAAGCVDADSCCAACVQTLYGGGECAAWHYDPQKGCHIFPTPPGGDPQPCDGCSAALSNATPGHNMPPRPPAACMWMSGQLGVQFVLVPIDPRTGEAGEPVPDLLCASTYKYDAGRGTAAGVSFLLTNLTAKPFGTFDPDTARFAVVGNLDPQLYATSQGYNFGAIDAVSSVLYLHAGPLSGHATQQLALDMRDGSVRGDVKVCSGTLPELSSCVQFLSW